ncbi:MAG: hypothetical protein HWD59_08940 [Coxiellaceae bacterium]|nr:MAG: hypothetical protein HWD59_08940 [Coxiellaceae bacterium]
MQESADAGGSLYAERESQLAEQLRQALLKGPLRNIALGKQYQPNQFLADLNHCNFALCNAYKAYFLLPNDPNQAYQYLLQASQQWQDFMGRCTSLSAFHDSNTPSTLTEIKTAYPNQTSITAMIANINQGISADVDAQLGMPLLIIKHTPEALNNMDYRYAFIESGSSPQTYVDEALPAAPKLDALDQLIASKIGPLIEKLHEAGEIGSIYLDIDAVGANDRRKLLLAPQLIKSPTAATIAQVLEDGHQWFKTSDEYNNFVNKFNEAAAEISQYYQKHLN